MQATEQVGPHAHHPRLRIEGQQLHTGVGQLAQELGAQLGRAIAVHQHFHAHAALRRFDQHALQILAHFVLVEDEGFDQHFFTGLANGLEDRRKELLAIDQQLDFVAVTPLLAHRRTSTARGT